MYIVPTALSYISFFLLVLIHSETEKKTIFAIQVFYKYALKFYEMLIILCPRNTREKISHRFTA